MKFLLQLKGVYIFVVLPKFEVTVHLPSFVLTNAFQVQGIIEAKYENVILITDKKIVTAFKTMFVKYLKTEPFCVVIKWINLYDLTNFSAHILNVLQYYYFYHIIGVQRKIKFKSNDIFSKNQKLI